MKTTIKKNRHVNSDVVYKILNIYKLNKFALKRMKF